MIINSKWPDKYKKILNTHQIIEQNPEGGCIKTEVIFRIMEYDTIGTQFHYSKQHVILDSTLRLLNGTTKPIEDGSNYGQKDFELAWDSLNLLQKYLTEFKMYEKLNRIDEDFV